MLFLTKLLRDINFKYIVRSPNFSAVLKILVDNTVVDCRQHYRNAALKERTKQFKLEQVRVLKYSAAVMSVKSQQ